MHWIDISVSYAQGLFTAEKVIYAPVSFLKRTLCMVSWLIYIEMPKENHCN